MLKSLKCLQTANKSASIHTNQILLSSNRLELSPRSFSHVCKKIKTIMRWICMSKALRFLQITAEHQDCPFFTVFLTIKTSSQNISITLLQISLKLHEHQGGYWRKKLPWTIFEEQFPVPRNTAAVKYVIASFPRYDNSNIVATLIITNFHLPPHKYNCGGNFSKSLFMVT